MTEEKKKDTIIYSIDDIYNFAYCRNTYNYITVIHYFIDYVENYLKTDVDNWDYKICLAFLYIINGKKFSPDTKSILEAISILEEGCKRNIGMAFNILGYYYRNYKYNHGIEKYYKEAVEFFTKACEMNIGDAFVNLGDMYTDGFYFRKDHRKAIELFTRGCELNCGRAFEQLGLIYGFDDVRENHNKTLELYKKSMKLGGINAFFEIIKYYEDDVDINDIAEFVYKKNLVKFKIYEYNHDKKYIKSLHTIYEKNMQISELKQLMLMDVSKGKGDLIIAESAQYLA
jgi:TPR repeat protein